MNQKLSDWASVAEIISGIAVVVTLVFLVFGIRENTEITRADAYARNLDSLNQSRRQLAQDEEMARIYQAWWEGRGGELDRGERYRLRLWLSAIWADYEMAYFANEYGTLGPSEWRRFETAACENRARMLDPMLWSEIESFFSEPFADFMERRCR